MTAKPAAQTPGLIRGSKLKPIPAPDRLFAPLTQGVSVEPTIPQHVANAFHAEKEEPEQLGAAWGFGIRLGQKVFTPVVSPPAAAWSAKVRGQISAPEFRVARPVRSTDGRVVVGGWSASYFAVGQPAARVDETVRVGLALDRALADIAPVTRGNEEDPRLAVFQRADAWAWAHEPHQAAASDPQRVADALTIAQRLHAVCEPLDAPAQSCHADLLATTLFRGSHPPVITDVVCVHRPAGYTAALAMVDGLVAGLVDPGIIRRFGYIPHLHTLLRRAVLYRMYVRLYHPDISDRSITSLSEVAGMIPEGDHNC